MNHKLFIPGQRIVRTVIAVLLCMLVYEARGRRGMPIFALIAAVMCITPYTRDTKAIAKRRVVGTLIGAGLGVITLLLEFRLFSMGEPDGILHYIIAALGSGIFVGKKSFSSRFPQYLIKAIFVFALAVAFIIVSSFKI